MKSIKKVLAIICALTAMTTAVASAEWQFAGYDTTTPPYYGKIYNEVIDGHYTSNQKREPVAEKNVEWKFEGYELQWPHVGYERLYLEGNAQNAVTRTTNRFPQWETRFRDYMWEVCGDHVIYQRQQTKINNAYWAWDFGKDAYDESFVFVPTTRTADVVDEFRSYGIANLDNNGKYVYDVTGKVYNKEKYTVYQAFGVMPAPFDVYLDEEGKPTKEIKAGNYLHADNLSARDINGQFIVSDADIAKYIDLPKSKFAIGPSYYGESGTKDVAAMYYANRNEGWFWDADTVKFTDEAVIGWTAPLYEMEEPYYYYQYLIVNGIVMDGRADTPRIYRYTGGKATPDVEWRYAFVEAAYPFNVVEFKYIRDNNGKMVQAFENDEPIYRYPSGEFGNSYFKITDTEIQYWVKDATGDYMVDSINRADANYGDYYAGYTSAAGFTSIY